MPEKKTDEKERPPAEKPVSLWGISFKEALEGLLKTRPMPKENKKSKGNDKNAN